MATVINLAPLADGEIQLQRDGEVVVSFSDRLPAALVPIVLSFMDDSGDLRMTADNIGKLLAIISRMITESNPDWTDDMVMNTIGLADLPALVQAVLNPQALSSMSTPETIEESLPVAIRKRKR